jgi:hypothetical protein
VDLETDVLLNGASVGTPTIADGDNLGSAASVTNTMAATDYLTVDVTQVGSTTPGANLTLRIRYRRNL